VTKIVSLLPFGQSPMTLDQHMLSEQREILLTAIDLAKFNYSKAARNLNLTLRSLRYRCEKCGLWLKHPKRAVKRESLFMRGWPALRMAILKRDKGRCRCCGATAKDGIRLHIDHILPRKTHPHLALDQNNLQVLCEPCNLSKSTKDFTDWR